MKKISNLIVLLLVSFITAGCNQYISSEVTDVNNVSKTYYGAYNRRDMVMADVIIYEKNSENYCDGVIYLKAPSRSITMKNDRVDAKMKLACTDGKLMDINWKLRRGSFSDGTAEGVDQYNNTYKFKTISKKQYKYNYGRKVEIPNKEFLLKY